ncbi:MAG: hypothetical protein O2783_08340, partial [Chloroflexi bacterium]|nr:hypothetical protein [Chloroflexota bacterium]
MKSKSRFGIVSVVVVAIFALLYVLPALASDGTMSKTAGDVVLDVKVHDPGAGAGQVAVISTSIATNTVDAQDTKVNNTLYVSNAATAYNRVLVQVLDKTADATGGADTVTVVVKN